MISSKSNILKSLAISVALFVLPLFCVTGVNKVKANAAGTYPTGDMPAPPAITEIFPDAESTESETSEKDGVQTNKRVFNTSLDAIPVSTGDHYKYLSDAEKIIYNVTYRAIVTGNYIPYSQKSNATNNYPYLNTYKALVYSGNTTFQAAYGLSNTEYTNALNRASEALYFDHPGNVEFYMCHASHYWSVYDKGVYYSYIVLYAGYDESKFASLNAEIAASLKSWISELKNSGNGLVNSNWDALTELNVHDYYASKLKYDYSCASDGSTSGYFNLSHTAYGALCKNYAVCDGYSVGFELIMEGLGIDTMIIAGYAKGGHAWNIVRLDGAWYEVDTTWAIPSGGKLSHDWFNRTTAEYAAGLGDSSRAHTRKNNAAFVGFRMPIAQGIHYTYSYLTNTAEGDLQRDSDYVALKGMTLQQTSVEMKVGEKMVLSPVFTPADATIQDYSLSTSNYDVVEANGNTIEAVAPGSATIAATSTDGGFKAQCLVTVTGTPEKVNAQTSDKDVGSKISDNIGSAKGIFVITSKENATVAYKSGVKKNATSVSIPSTVKDENGCVYKVTEICANAFKGFKKLKKVVIPDTVIVIDKGAFKNCSKLSVIKIRGNSLKRINSGAFKGIRKGADFTIFAASKKKYNKIVKMSKKAGALEAAFKFQKKQS